MFTLLTSIFLELRQNKRELDNTWKRLESNRNLDLIIYLQLTTDIHLDRSEIHSNTHITIVW